MLKPAILYKEILIKKHIEAISDPHFKFYNCDGWHDYDYKIYDSDWNRIQRVSIGVNGNIIGLVEVYIDRDSKIISSFAILNFTKKPNSEFSKDLLTFLRSLRDDFGALKFEFSAVEGGPSDTMYKKFIKKHGGRVIGVRTNSFKLTDGKYYNQTLFEIMRKDMNF